MICRSCRQQDHESCPGGSWCDCQHKPLPDPDSQAEPTEPKLVWVRQG